LRGRMENVEDVFNDALTLLGGKPVPDVEVVAYGPLKVTLAPKEGRVRICAKLLEEV